MEGASYGSKRERRTSDVRVGRIRVRSATPGGDSAGSCGESPGQGVAVRSRQGGPIPGRPGPEARMVRGPSRQARPRRGWRGLLPGGGKERRWAYGLGGQRQDESFGKRNIQEQEEERNYGK